MATSAAFVPVGLVGKVGPEAEEEEEAEQADCSLEAKLAEVEAEAGSPFTEAELAERKRKFEFLKEHRRQKWLEQRLARENEVSEKARAALERILREDAERSVQETEGTMSEEAMMESAGVGIGYIEDENGKLTKRSATVLRTTPARRKTPTRRRTPANGVHTPQRFTQADLERVNKNRCRYTRAAWLKQLLAIFEGRLPVTKEQHEALLAYGRAKGWNRRPPSKR